MCFQELMTNTKQLQQTIQQHHECNTINLTLNQSLYCILSTVLATTPTDGAYQDICLSTGEENFVQMNTYKHLMLLLLLRLSTSTQPPLLPSSPFFMCPFSLFPCYCCFFFRAHKIHHLNLSRLVSPNCALLSFDCHNKHKKVIPNV